MTRRSPNRRAAEPPNRTLAIGSPVALISAIVVGLVGVSLLVVLVVGLLDGVRGTGPLLLGGLALGVFALAVRLLIVSRKLRTRPAAVVRPRQQVAPRRRPQPRPVTRRR